MKKAARSLHIHDRLEIYHLEAYFGVQNRTAHTYRKELLNFFHRRSGVLVLYDLAVYDNLSNEDLLNRMHYLLFKE